MSSKKNKKKRRHRHKLLRGIAVAVCVVAVLALIIAVGGTLLISHYYNKMNFVEDEDVTIYDPSQLASMEGSSDDSGEIYIREDETDADGNVVGSSYKLINKDDLSPEEQESIEESIAGQLADRQEQQEQIEQIPVSESVHVYNLLFIGVDLRAGQNWNGNSDSMILISINSNTHQIYMTSFMRDLYVNIPGIGYDKLNRAHALGGGPLLIQTIEQNFRIHIDNYATVNFYSLISIIDAIGGIDMTISADEATVANGYISEMCAGNGLSPESYYLSGGGTVHLNGMQAVAYSRIRYVGNADFGRTERQRMVLMQMFAKLQNNPGQVTAFLNTALPLVTHNIPQNVVTSLIVNAPSYLGYQLVSQRVPFDGTYSYAGEMLVPDFNYTISMLQATLYQ
jgi:LCP family protein required for cell wall assembly